MINIEEYFARANKEKINDTLFLTGSELAKLEKRIALKGARIFKRKALGFWGKKTTKSINELAKVLTEIGIVKTTQEAENELIPRLYNSSLGYSKDSYGESRIKFTPVQNLRGEKAIRIEVVYEDVNAN